MTERTWVIVNPAAGGGRTGRAWPGLAERLRRAGIAFTPCVTCGPGDGAICARAALGDGAETIVVVGGDGTLNETVNGCLAAGREGGSRPTLALLPTGTGHDFARLLSIRDEAAALAALRCGTPRAVDVGRIAFRDDAGEERERFFINVADFGLGRVTNEAIARGPRLPGGLAYLYGALASIAAYAPATIEIEVDGERAYHGSSGMLVIANGRFFGGGMRVAPKARPDDGLFDIGVLEGVSRAALAGGLLPRVYRGTHLRHPTVHFFRGATVRVTAATPFPLQADGETLGHAPAHFTLLPRAFRVLAPAADAPTRAES